MTFQDVIIFIEKFWLQILLTAISTFLAARVKTMYSKMKKEREDREKEVKAEKEKQAVMREALLALLHDRLLQATLYYLKAGEITADELDNLEIMFNSYSSLGGNGTIKRLMEKVRNLKIVPPEYISAQYK